MSDGVSFSKRLMSDMRWDSVQAALADEAGKNDPERTEERPETVAGPMPGMSARRER